TLTAYVALEGADYRGYEKSLADVADRAAHATVFVAVDGDRLLGGVTFVDGPGNRYAEDLRAGEAGIRMLAVAPTEQGRGVGRALTDACLVLARAGGAERVALHSTKWMTGAHRLYESMGSRRTPERDLLVDGDVHLLSFVLDLEPLPSRSEPGGRNR